jgi:hypothetical protein
VSKRSKARVCARSPVEFEGSNPEGDSAGWLSVCFECCELSGTSLCDGPIPRSEDSYTVCGCVCVNLGIR